MLGEPAKHISERALTVWKIRGIITSGLSLLIYVTISVVIFIFHWPKWIIIPLVLLWIVETYFIIFFNPKLR